MALNLSRNTRVWISTVETGHDNTNTWEVGVQDGYTYSRSMTSTDITVDEAGPAPVRGSKRFNDSLDPTEWSFTVYTRPFKLSDSHPEPALQGIHQVVEELLWHSLASGSTPDFTDSDGDQEPPIYGTSSEFLVGFTDNSSHQLTNLYIYLEVDNTVFLIKEATVNTAELSVDITDISQVAWSGQGTDLEVLDTKPTFMSSPGAEYVTTNPTADSYVAIPTGADYLINKYTQLKLDSEVSGSLINYDIAITAATITISNNITYLTPSTLGTVDTPIGYFTGTFDVSGTMDCYMNDKTNGSEDLFKHLAASKDVNNSADMTFYIGGETATPRIEVQIPLAHLSVPAISVDDVISQSMEFKGIPSTSELNNGDEINLKFVAS